jgi:hypothetical protein
LEVNSIVKNMNIGIFKEVVALNYNFKEQEEVIAKLYKDINEMRENTKDNFQEFKSLIAKILTKSDT